MANEWDITYPIDHTTIGDVPGEIRKLKASVKTQMDREHEIAVDGDATGSEHSLGSAVLYLGTSAPTNRPDGATALAVNNIDKSRLWLDTNYSPPMIKKWSGTAWVPVTTIGAIPIDSATGVAAAYIQNLFGEDGDGERVCRLLAKGSQSGDELTTLGYVEFSHEGAADDQKGQMRIVLNDGDDSNAPSKVAVVFMSTGKIDASESLAILDEDDMASDDAQVLATQQSIKAFVVANGHPIIDDGSPAATAVTTKYLTGTTDADSETSVAHGITGIDNILSVTAAIFSSSLSKYIAADVAVGPGANNIWTTLYDGTNVILTSVGTDLQSQKYRIRIDYQ